LEEQDVLTIKELPGTLVVFMIGQTCMNLEATGIVETKTVRSAPSYPDVIPKQKVIKQEERSVEDRKVGFRVKAYLPDVLVVEASVDVNSILADTTLELKRKLVTECRKVPAEFTCNDVNCNGLPFRHSSSVTFFLKQQYKNKLRLSANHNSNLTSGPSGVINSIIGK
jgi:hypothetical protein